MRTILIVLVLLMASAESLFAQRRIPRFGVSEPSIWITAGAGFFTGNGVNDGRTESTWDFGSSTNYQFRASLEKTVGDRASIGFIGTYVRVPFIYESTLIGVPADGVTCGTCEAHLDMMALSAGFHVGGGPGFHQVIEGTAGVVQYSNLTRDSDGEKLAPTGGNLDPIFSFGYGFGYGFGQNTAINLVQDLGIALHEKNGLANGVRNTNSVRTLRFTARFGFGTRSRRR